MECSSRRNGMQYLIQGLPNPSEAHTPPSW
jgi:hypothetical protein